MLSCKQATELMSQSQDQRLGLRERFALRMHLLMCLGCRNFDRQLVFLRRAADRLVANLREPRD